MRGDSFLGRGKGKQGEFLKPPQANFPACRERWRIKEIRAEREKKLFPQEIKLANPSSYELVWNILELSSLFTLCVHKCEWLSQSQSQNLTNPGCSDGAGREFCLEDVFVSHLKLPCFTFIRLLNPLLCGLVSSYTSYACIHCYLAGF